MGLLKEINLNAEHLTSQEKEALLRMLDKREFYVEQGRFREAHGAGSVIHILWRTLLGFSDTVPSMPADLYKESEAPNIEESIWDIPPLPSDFYLEQILAEEVPKKEKNKWTLRRR